MEKQATCEERIGAHLESRMDGLREAINGLNTCEDCGHEWAEDDPIECPECGSDDIQEAEHMGHTWEQYEQGILAFEKTELYTVLLSTGGPHDEIRLYVRDKEIIRAEYRFQDWFDGATRPITGPDFDLIVQAFGDWVEYQ